MRAVVIWSGIAVAAAAIGVGVILGFDAFRVGGPPRESIFTNPLGPDGVVVVAGVVTVVAITGALTSAWWRARRPGPRVVLGVAAAVSGLAVVPVLWTLVIVAAITAASSSRAPVG